MKKKNLIILLIMPFIIALLGLMTANVTFKTFYQDITYIEWDYDDVEAFKLDINHQLKARAYMSSDAPVDDGNTLIWSVENKNKEELIPHAEINVINNKSYLMPQSEGEVIITCSNLKGNVFKKMTGIIYTDGVITIQPTITSSQNNIDEKIYYGEYDLKDSNKVNASFELKLKCIPNTLIDNLSITTSDNIRYEVNNNLVTVTVMNNITNYDAYVYVNASGLKAQYDFKIVDEGINVYTYSMLY